MFTVTTDPHPTATIRNLTRDKVRYTEKYTHAHTENQYYSCFDLKKKNFGCLETHLLVTLQLSENRSDQDGYKKNRSTLHKRESCQIEQ